MSMRDSFFSKGTFKGSKCKTLLKLTIPRIKLLRNRREIHIKQMRRDIAKLLETGQEATARIRVEHIIREEKMMVAQEIIELFCELVVVRLPIIETQRECPIDLKEAISSLCFAAPRCADLPELTQVQMAFAAKYGKEFIAAATELMPECGVNRQLIEHLSIHDPTLDIKLNLLKEIAKEHDLDWDPTVSETELLKPHEDLLNGPSQLPLPQEKHDEPAHTESEQQTHNEHSDSDPEFDLLDFPVIPTSETISRPENKLEINKTEKNKTEKKQFLPFVSPPSPTISVKESNPYHRNQTNHNLQTTVVKETKTGIKDDLQDLLDAARSAAESADRAAVVARAAASLCEVRISELVEKQNEYEPNENPFFGDENEPRTPEKSNVDHQDSGHDHDGVFSYSNSLSHQPQRLPSIEDGFMSYPNLFNSREPSFDDNGRFSDEQ